MVARSAIMDGIKDGTSETKMIGGKDIIVTLSTAKSFLITQIRNECWKTKDLDRFKIGLCKIFNEM